MASFEDWSDDEEHDVNGNSLHLLSLRDGQDQVAHDKTIAVVPNHYARSADVADILEKLGKEAAAKYLRTKFPAKQNLRSGDLGEIFASEYISEKTEFEAPIKKLWWRDHRNWPMKGDDVIGIRTADQGQNIKFLKVEAKSQKDLSEKTVSKARVALDGDNSFPAPHALAFIADRLQEIGDVELSDQVRRAQLLDGISANQVQHMLFTFSGNDPDALLRADLGNYAGPVTQSSIGLRISYHQDFIRSIFKAIGGDDES
ncbi:Hachiman antiphage defense system protein HamA [Primorskyibacter flagellatus]|uniref:Anti-bacteriophage protein A/HamA C-terminal domain-containing protein n=1 Tax=Primorskyibacter flagellatus TaxID=1387277 RepID=A0A1W2E4Z9_9RHOB|nr:Hachiman antiphage defense system protein HamA [Primorskyibacter flagellatus]SMD04482.1 protein of unknown function [Primorskyibacter flagellatus]